MLNGNCFSSFLYNKSLSGFSIQDDLKLNGTHQLLVYADDVNIWGGNVHTVKKNSEAF
jgi:hypothetical protein